MSTPAESWKPGIDYGIILRDPAECPHVAMSRNLKGEQYLLTTFQELNRGMRSIPVSWRCYLCGETRTTPPPPPGVER